MNILVDWLERRPQILDRLTDAEENVSLDRLYDDVFLEPLLEPFIRAVRDEPVFADYWSRAHLPLLDGWRWREMLREAAQYEPVQAAEWVTFAPAIQSPRGVTLPDDSSSIARLSLFFVDNEGVYRRISVDELRNSPVSWSVSVSAGHCGFAPQGTCRGRCPDCRPREKVGRPAGVVCWCPHQR
jgi:hypothetical protein